MAGDEESRQGRRLQGYYALIAKCTCLLLSLCAVYWVTIGVTHIISQRAVYLMLTGILCFLYYPCNKRSPMDRFSIPDIVLSLLWVAITIYVVEGYLDRVDRIGLPNTQDYIFGSLTIILGLEMVRRVLGPLLAIISLAFLVYAYFGPYMPDAIAHRGFNVGRIITHVFCGMEGIYGMATGVMCSFVLMFIIFGAFLERSGISKFLVNISIALTKRGRGGPAKAAVVSSALMGSISGSAIANVLTTGVFTIPMMKRIGYRPHVAAAVEAAASTGGQIMPPLMGAAAFVMVEFTQISYLEIIKVAAIPAILYFFVVFAFVHIEAVKHNISAAGIIEDHSEGSTYNALNILKKEWFFVLPLFFLVFLLMKGFSPMVSGFYSLLSTILVSMIQKETRMNFRDIIDAFALGARNSVVVGSISATIGIIIGIVGLTGLGLRFSDLSAMISGGSVFITVVFVIIVSFILGMGLPTTPAYIVLAIFSGPALADLGVPVMSAHLLMLWYSIDSQISPPVALTAYTAAGVARSHPIKTMFTAFKYAKGLYIIPFLFVYRPGILLAGSLSQIIISLIAIIFGLLAAVFGLEGFILKKISIIERILYCICALALFYNNLVWNGAGLAVFFLLAGFHWLLSRKEQAVLINV